MSFPSDIDVAIVAHDNLDVLPAALTSLADAGCPPGRITVVDVASTDGTADWLAREWPAVRIRRLDRNDGPSPGRNVAITEASRRFVWLMDADVRIRPDTVQLLHARMAADETIKIGSPIVVHESRPDLIQYAGGAMHYICEAINPWLDRPLAERGSAPSDIGAAPTCGLLLDRAAAVDVGLFDERYFIGKEDGDFTHRTRIAGHRILELPGSLVLHRSRPRGTWLFYYQIRNRWHFMLKNYQWRTLLLILPCLAVHEPLQLVVLHLQGHGRVYWKAVGGLCALLPSLPRDRALTRRIRRLPDSALLRSDALVIRGDLSGHPLVRMGKHAYEGFLRAYWRMLTRTVLAGMNPRVVVLTTYFRPIVGGVESNAERLARYLQVDGFDVRVITKRVTRALANADEVDGVRVDRIGPYGERSAAGKWRLLPAAFRWLVRHQAAYDVVCCVDYRGVGIAAIAARLFTRRRVVLQAQTPGGLVPRLLARPAIAVYRRADAFACISHGLEREAEAAGVPANRIHFLPNAVDAAQFRPAGADERDARRRQLDVPEHAVACLFVGRLSREKGLMDLMEAWRLADVAESQGAVLLVAGPDMVRHPWNEGPAARDFVARHGLGRSVRFLGSIADVAPLLRAVDVVIQPSHFEALGLSAVEALASGVPVIASAVGGLLDFVIDGRNGRLCPPRDAAALAACIRELVGDTALRRRLAAAARASVLDEYDERAVFARFASLLRQLAGPPA